jgi:hypothetical protein
MPICGAKVRGFVEIAKDMVQVSTSMKALLWLETRPIS